MHFSEQLILMVILSAVLVIGAVLLVAILFLINLKRLLDEISPENRKVEPGYVFLMLIPLFNLVYGFILYPKISESIENEYNSRSKPLSGDSLRSLGLILAVLMLLSVVVNYVMEDLGGLIGLGYLVIFILYWVKSAGIKNELKRTGVSGRADILDL